MIAAVSQPPASHILANIRTREEPTMNLSLFLYLVAVILIGLAAFGVNPPRVSLAWLGMALAVFTFGVLPALTP